MGIGKILLVSSGSFIGGVLIFVSGIYIGYKNGLQESQYSYNQPALSTSPNNSSMDNSSNSSTPIQTPATSNSTNTGNQNISSLPQTVQNVLQFQPQGDSADVIDMVEQDFGYSSWEGSYSVPGTFTTTPGPHGSTNVQWTLTTKPSGIITSTPSIAEMAIETADMGENFNLSGKLSKEQFKKDSQMLGPGNTIRFDFNISQDGSFLTPENFFSKFVINFNSNTNSGN
ncbi:hypothetical protein ACOJUR_12080 [Alicyclobacillus tolerans]|uniref:hypothetical protein n=1 Tax=Alicyclobacillus tolerans TaxID=90970 RepID=UPI003B8145CC